VVLVLGAWGLFPATPAVSADKESEDGWVSLFNGKNLDGWVQRGGKAHYRAEKGQIVGSSAPNTSNSFLCTKKEYSNFILELEFKVEPGLNSGVQVRSQYDEKRNRVFGYQVEIDPSDRAWTGGIYDEGRRGWLYDLKNHEAARKAFKPNEWNKFHIESKGTRSRPGSMASRPPTSRTP